MLLASLCQEHLMTGKTKKTYHILTYGCQMNERDSETIAGLLEAAGYEGASGPDDADVVVFNTCSVRHSAENKVFGKLGEIRLLKTKKPGMVIAFGGCMAQLPEVRKRLKKNSVDIVFGTHNIHRLPELLARREAEAAMVTEVWDKAVEVVEGVPSRRTGGLSAFVNIMFGCNNFCSYCIVPYTRGRERSRNPQEVVKEVRELVALGAKEVTLLGQNVNSYGRGLEEKADFADLLTMINDIEGLWRIRFTTSHPRDVSDKLIQTIADLDKVCEHVHTPLQSGSNKILKLMNRGYSREDYFNLADRIRSGIPGVAITSDIIVGFPGEEEEDYLDTLDAIERVRFDAAFTFMYSKRTGTRACDMEGHVPLEIKRNRLIKLNQIQYAMALEENLRFENRTEEVLVEGKSKTNPDRLTGRTRTNRIVVFDGPAELIGQLTRVVVTEAKTFTLFGQLAGIE
ncbi:MAG: tRNA (N6-isopentenyl adenosine(37)-C2)-methylthiotransferase MiaB [Chitinophagales bacterium]